jgi:hypothetical protein
MERKGGQAEHEEDRVVAMLAERGVTNAREEMLTGPSLDAILGAIKWFDDLPSGRAGTGLLVAKIRDGGMPGYKRPHERTGPKGELVVGDEEIALIRGFCYSPDGMSRPEAEAAFARLAKRANTPVGSLIDSAVVDGWVETPPHPAKLHPHDCDGHQDVRYGLWVRQNLPTGPANPEVRRKDGESEFAFSCRFWGWQENEAVQAAIQRKLDRIRERNSERKSERKSDPKSPPKPVSTAVEAERQRLDAKWGVTMPDEDEPDNSADLPDGQSETGEDGEELMW